MPESASIGAGRLLRPLLDCDAAGIAAYAASNGLTWFDDPSNASDRFDRNYLRRHVMPLLRARWPASSATLSRAAAWQADADRLLTAQAAADARRATTRADRVSAEAVAALDPARRANLLRFLCRAAGASTPDARRLAAALDLACGPTPRGHVRWPGGEVRRYRDLVYLSPPLPGPPDDDWEARPDRDGVLALPPGYGRLQYRAAAVAADARCRFRRGGERVRPGTDRPSSAFAAWCQQLGVPPWLRERLPLTFRGDELVAVGETAVAPAVRAFAPRWLDRPPGLSA